MRVQRFYAATLVIATFASITAQQPAPSPAPPAQDDVVRVTTNLVQADVIVTDKSGRQVSDLRPEDFEVLEDGKRQTLSHFSYISTDRPNQPDAAKKSHDRNSSTELPPLPISAAQTRRTLAIVVDDLGLSAESIVSVRKALKEFVENQMQPHDLVAIVQTTKGSGALQQFTSDKKRLLATIERITWYAAGRGGLSPFAPVNTQTEVTSVQGAQILSEIEEERASQYAVGTIGTLNLVVRGLRDVTGRKAVLLIAESFRLFTTQGRNIRLIESLKNVADQANRSSTVLYTLDASGLNPLNLTAEDKVAGLSYTFDPNAFQNPGSPPTPPLRNRGTPRRNDVAPTAASIALEEGGSSAAFKRLDALVAQRDNQNVQNHSVLSFLADRTGGLFTANTNNLSLATERMLQDQSGYYLLAYRPSEPNPDSKEGRARFHKLNIKVKRSGLNVRSREGYYTGTNEIASTKTREQRLSQALISPFAAGAVAVRITPLFFNDRAEGSYLRVLLHLEAKDLTFNEQSNKQQTVLDVAAVNLGEDGKVVDQFSDTQKLDVDGEAFPGVLKNGLSFVLNVPVKKSGAYQLRVAIRDVATDRIGSAGQFVQVPDVSKNHLSLSGIVISGINQGATTGGDALLQAVPSLRRLTHGLVLSYSYTIYNAEVNATGRPQLETQMFLFREGKQVFTGKLSPFDPGTQTDMKRLRVTGGLRLGPELPAGGYVLQVMVTDKLRDKPNTTLQTLDFVIVE